MNNIDKVIKSFMGSSYADKGAWCKDGKIFATNGHIAICVPALLTETVYRVGTSKDPKVESVLNEETKLKKCQLKDIEKALSKITPNFEDEMGTCPTCGSFEAVVVCERSEPILTVMKYRKQKYNWHLLKKVAVALEVFGGDWQEAYGSAHGDYHIPSLIFKGNQGVVIVIMPVRF